MSAVHPQWYAERFVKFLMAHTDYEEEMQRKAEMQMVPSGEVEILPVVEESEEGREVEEVREVESVKSNVEDSEVFEEAQQNLEMTSLNVNLSNENSTLRPHTVEDIDVQEKIALATTDVAVEQQRKVVPCTASSAVNADDLPPPVRPVRTNRDASIKRSNSTPMPTTTDKAIDTQVMPPGPVPNSQQSPTRLSPGPPLQIGGQTRSTLFQKIQEKQAALERQQSGSQSAKISTANNSSRALIRQAIERSSSQKLNGSGSRDVGNGAPSPNSSATLSPSGRLTLYQKIQKKQSILQAQQSPSANTIAGVNGNPPIIRRQLSGGMKPTRVVNQESGRYA